VAGGKVVTLGVRGALSCLDAATGKMLWRKEEFQGATPTFFTGSSPMVVDGLCIAQLGGSENGGIVAYDLATGAEKWKWTGDGPAYGSPALMTVAGTRLIVAPTERKLVAIAAADGKLVWETPLGGGRGPGSYNAATPIVDGQTLIYFSGRGARAVKFEREGGGFVARDLWSNPDSTVQFNTPVLKDGLLYGLSQRNELFCINAANGTTAWSAPAGQAGGAGVGGRPGRGGGFGSILDAGPVLLALTPGSELIVFQPGDKAYTEKARIKVADTPTHAHPVIAGNRVYVKDRDAVTLWTLQ
jgi:outer membrane protein assembly factor BamB